MILIEITTMIVILLLPLMLRRHLPLPAAESVKWQPLLTATPTSTALYCVPVQLLFRAKFENFRKPYLKPRGGT